LRLRERTYVSKELPIAVIDDDESFRAALLELLCSLGHVVRGFSSAEDFVAAGGVNSYNCIITDIQMSGMTGIELKRLLTARDCRVPVIMVTARTEPGLEAKAVASGALCLLRKPFETNALIGYLDSALRT
jgi:FixJ family two-component response regulator